MEGTIQRLALMGILIQKTVTIIRATKTGMTKAVMTKAVVAVMAPKELYL